MRRGLCATHCSVYALLLDRARRRQRWRHLPVDSLHAALGKECATVWDRARSCSRGACLMLLLSLLLRRMHARAILSRARAPRTAGTVARVRGPALGRRWADHSRVGGELKRATIVLCLLLCCVGVYIVPRTGLAQTCKRTEKLQKPP
jgi:hypothetical protein